MKKLFDIFTDDEKSFEDLGDHPFLYALIFPLGLVLLMAIAGWMESLV